MQIKGFYDRTLYRDEYSGMTFFTFVPEKLAAIVCKGMMQHIPAGTPIIITAEKRIDKQGRDIYVVSNYDFCVNGNKAIHDFLSSLKLKGITETIIKKIQLKHTDIFEFASQYDAVKELVEYGVEESYARQAIQAIRDIRNIKDIMSDLFVYGIKYAEVLRVYKSFKIQAIRQNPYLMIKAGVPYHICEKIGKEQNISGFSSERLNALMTTAMNDYIRQGHTKITFKMLSDRCFQIEKMADNGYRTSPFFFLANLVNAGFVVIKDNGSWFIYKKHLYDAELRIAREIKRINLKGEAWDLTEAFINNIEKKLNIKYSPEQKQAFELIKTPGVKILTGGPGTGKTTILHGLIEAYKERYPGRKITLCAPTGCAAKQLTKSTSERALTVHKLLGIKAFGNTFIQSKNENNRLASDFIIVDESSMIDTDLMERLIKSVKNNAIILFVGDEDQLPAVGCGNILHDLIEADTIPSCRLVKVYRQNIDSLIVENSIYIKNGLYNKIKQGDDYKILTVHSGEDLEKIALKILSKSRGQNVKIFSPIKNPKYEASTTIINNAMHDFWHKDNDAVLYKGKKFSKGDPVVFTVNNYKLGYYNGDFGTITAITSEGNKKEIEIKTEDGTYVLTTMNFDDIDLAYAITVHKSQGSECDISVILLPSSPENMLTKQLIYVAATRAKNKNIIISENDAFKKAVLNKKEKLRLTGLKYRIWEISR